MLCEWLLARGITPPSLKEMPKIGYVAYKGRIPGAMAFLRRVEGGFGQCDGLVSNPIASAVDRYECLDAVIDQVVLKAKSMELKGLIAFTLDDNTLERALKHRFQKQSHHFLSYSFEDL